MKITICSRNAIEKRMQEGKMEKIAVISFYEPEWKKRGKNDPVDFSGRCDRVMRIPLHDLDPEALSDFGLKVDTYFPEADVLAEFIYKAKEDGLDIICQCEYGQSRSAGCAAAILEHFAGRGIDVFADYRYYPNQLVYHKVKNALAKCHKTEQSRSEQ